MEAAASAARRATPWMRWRTGGDEARSRGGLALALEDSRKSVPRKGLTLRVQQPAVRPLRGRGRPPVGRSARRRRNERDGAARLYKLYLPQAPELSPASFMKKSIPRRRMGEGEDESSVLATPRAGDRLLSRERGGAAGGDRPDVERRRPRRARVGRPRRAVRVESERRCAEGPGAATDADAWRVDRDDGGGTMSARARRARGRVRVNGGARGGAAPPPVRSRAARLTSTPPTPLRGLSPEGAAAVAALNDEQRAAVRAAPAARDYALIQGFPARKSATAMIVRASDTGKSVSAPRTRTAPWTTCSSVCPASASTTHRTRRRRGGQGVGIRGGLSRGWRSTRRACGGAAPPRGHRAPPVPPATPRRTTRGIGAETRAATAKPPKTKRNLNPRRARSTSSWTRPGR